SFSRSSTSRRLKLTWPSSILLILACEARMAYPASWREIPLLLRKRRSWVPRRMRSTVGPPLELARKSSLTCKSWAWSVVKAPSLWRLLSERLPSITTSFHCGQTALDGSFVLPCPVLMWMSLLVLGSEFSLPGLPIRAVRPIVLPGHHAARAYVSYRCKPRSPARTSRATRHHIVRTATNDEQMPSA